MLKHKGTVTLETERLILRKFTEEDAPAVFQNWASDDEVTKYLTWPTHQSVENSLGYMRFLLDTYKEKNSYQWGIELKETGELFGNISVVKIEEEVDAVELGYVIGRRFWNNGYMTEAVKAVIAFLFDQVGARRIAARHDINNPGSGKVMQKAGMRYEGTLRQSDRNNQGIVDCAVYSILKEEYRPYSYITLRERPELVDKAADWFHSKWSVPREAYLACMKAYLNGETEYGWYLCLYGEDIVGGMGVIENDFHNRKDLSPNICAVYTEEAHRCKGIAGRLLNTVVEDLSSKDISPVYLLTDHTGFYERYGWKFLCMVQGDGESYMSRMYIHE